MKKILFILVLLPFLAQSQPVINWGTPRTIHRHVFKVNADSGLLSKGLPVATEAYTDSLASALTLQSVTSSGNVTDRSITVGDTLNVGEVILIGGVPALKQDTLDALTFPWDRITERPVTIEGFGITDGLRVQDSTEKYLTPAQTESLVMEIIAHTIQIHTSGEAVTVSSASTWLIVDPEASIETLTVTLPAATSGRELTISFGGSITTGAVVEALTISPNSGQSIIQATTPSEVEAGDAITYRFYNNIWYRL